MMNFLKRLGVVIYMLLMLGAGGLFIVLGLKLCTIEQCLYLAGVVTASVSGQIILIAIGGIFLVIGVIVPYRMERTLRKKRIVAFQNPDGEVMVSISAIEDYVRKIAKSIPEIKDIRSNVDISRKGITIVAAVSITAGTNIPKITEKIQMEVKNKVQVMLGVEEKIDIKVFIKKIAGQDGESARERTEDTASAAIPYREIG